MNLKLDGFCFRSLEGDLGESSIFIFGVLLNCTSPYGVNSLLNCHS